MAHSKPTVQADFLWVRNMRPTSIAFPPCETADHIFPAREFAPGMHKISKSHYAAVSENPALSKWRDMGYFQVLSDSDVPDGTKEGLEPPRDPNELAEGVALSFVREATSMKFLRGWMALSRSKKLKSAIRERQRMLDPTVGQDGVSYKGTRKR